MTLAKPALNTLRYDHVAHLNFNFNSIPARKTVSCLLDSVEAVIGNGAETKTIPLEDFEDATSALWPFPATRLSVETTWCARGLAAVHPARKKDPWRTFGIFRNDPDFEAAARLGRDYRQQQTYDKELAGS